MRQKDRDARWTKKHGRSFFGYKNSAMPGSLGSMIRTSGMAVVMTFIAVVVVLVCY